MDVYQGTAVFKHHLIPTLFGARWCNTVMHRIEKQVVFIFLGFLCQILFAVGLGQKCAGFGIWPFVEFYGGLEYPAKGNCHDPFFLLCYMIVTNKKCVTVTSWLFYTVDQAELRGVIYFNFFNCAVFSLLTICQKISHGNSFIWWL